MLDLLDRSAVAKKVRTTAPNATTMMHRKRADEFKTTKDGRLIIVDLDGKVGDKRKATNDDDDDDECNKKKKVKVSS